MVDYGNDSKTYRTWESGTNIVQSRKCFIETLPIKLDASDHNHNDGSDDTSLHLVSYNTLSTRDIPETEAGAEPDTGDSNSGGTNRCRRRGN